jgi:putative membrane protein
VLLGAYKAFISAIHNLDFVTLLVFFSGAAIGLIAFSNILAVLLKKLYNQTIAILLGFIIGSLNIIWPWKVSMGFYVSKLGVPFPAPKENVLPSNYSNFVEQIIGQPADSLLWQAVVACLLGFALVLAIEGIGNKLSKK